MKVEGECGGEGGATPSNCLCGILGGRDRGGKDGEQDSGREERHGGGGWRGGRRTRRERKGREKENEGRERERGGGGER